MKEVYGYIRSQEFKQVYLADWPNVKNSICHRMHSQSLHNSGVHDQISTHYEDKILAGISRVGLGMILYFLKNCMHHVFLDSTPSPASQQAIRALFFC